MARCGLELLTGSWRVVISVLLVWPALCHDREAQALRSLADTGYLIRLWLYDEAVGMAP